MAIQVRRGNYADFDPTKLLPGEPAAVQNGDPNTTDGEAVYVALKSGSVKRLPTADELDAVDIIATSAAENATQALQGVGTLNTQVSGISQTLVTVGNNAEQALQETEALNIKTAALDNAVDSLALEAESYPDSAYVEDGTAYFTHNGEVLFEVTGIGGGGGGGGGTGAVLTATNTTGWLAKTVATGATVQLTFTWSSIEDEMPTGDGSLRVYDNNVLKTTRNVQQGNVTVDVSEYLVAGSNVVKVQIYDVYGQYRTFNFTITVVELSLTSTFTVTTPYTGTIAFPYTPVGAVSKTVYFELDGNVIGTQIVSTSGRQVTYTIPAQAHGTHRLSVYFTALIDGETVYSNTLYYEFMSVVSGNNTILISSQFNESTAEQYSTLVIPWMVYDPNSLTAQVKIYANNVLQTTVTVDRTEQSCSYRADNYGNLAIKFECGSTTKVISMTITESQIDVEAETEDLMLYLSAQGRSNQEEHPDTWEYEDISCSFSGFNWISDGWQSDADGITVMRVSGNARITIPYQIFAEDFRAIGKTIEVEFATRDVFNYDSTIMSCISDGRGLSITAQQATLTSEQSVISSQYKEDDHIRLAFTVGKRSENRLMLMYIDGICCGAVQYPDDDDFSQITPVNISIGSSDCTMDIYCIRVYDNDLTRFQILDNWIADTQLGYVMLDRYTRNHVYDAYGNVVIAQLPADLPYFIQTAPELPQYKGDKKTVSGSYTDPADERNSFTFAGAQSDVQGTSSQYYARKNYKIKFKNGITMNDGTVSPTYAMNADAIPTNTFTYKADVASSEGANNVELVRLYNEACPYKTPAQVANAKVRQGIDGFPIVMFWNDGNTVSFLGKYNFNNDKGTPEVFGFASPDESWETLNNTSDRVIWKSADYTGTDWLNDFEARYPDTDPAYTDATQLAAFAAWIVSTDRTAATGNALPSPVTYDETTYTHDTAAYRLAKFRAEAGNYMELNSAMFYYIFTELFLMVDSRAKNAFPSFIGSEVTN